MCLFFGWNNEKNDKKNDWLEKPCSYPGMPDQAQQILQDLTFN